MSKLSRLKCNMQSAYTSKGSEGAPNEGVKTKNVQGNDSVY